MEKERLFKHIFTIRAGGENGDKRFITLGNMMMSSKLHDTEEEAIKELENISVDNVAKMLIAVINFVEEYTNSNFVRKE